MTSMRARSMRELERCLHVNAVWGFGKRRRLSRRRQVIMELTALLLTFFIIYWQSPELVDSAASLGVRVSKVDVNTRWQEWNLVRSLKNIAPKFTPVPSVDCQSEPQAGYPFCNPKLTPEERATDLVSRLSLDEIIQQTSTIAPAISRLGIKDYNWRSNCLHGWSESGGHWLSGLAWTVFPAPVGLGASFDVELINKVGQVTADEGRALHNVMLAHFNGSSTEAAGLNCFSPNVNLFRDPRWGRGQETFGEDPYLLSHIGTAYTHGLQEGSDPKYLKIAACAKHYAVHSGPEELKLHFKASVSLHDLYDTYLPAFKSQVLGSKVAQMMPAYSGMRCSKQPDGAPDAANPFLLKTILRGQFSAPNISVVSDNGAVSVVFSDQKYVPSLELAASVCMNATTDLDLGHDEVYSTYLPQAVKDKLVKNDTLLAAVWRSFYLRFRVGDFDPPSMVPYQYIDSSHLNTSANQALNLQAARESIVLLKNTLDSLPLSVDGIKKLAVIGPNANATLALLSNYEGIPPGIVSVLQGIDETIGSNGPEVVYAPGCSSVKCPDTSEFDKALDLVHDADYVIAVMGLDGSVEGEGHDRAQTSCGSEKQDILALPGCQTELVDQVIGFNSKVILVLINGGPVSIPTLYNNKGIIGILEAFYPGALGGTAVANVLFGKYNPGGKMPVTVYESIDDVRAATDYDMSSSPGRTYRYFTGEPLIPFGFGLSYTTFEYSQVTVTPSSIKTCESVKVSVSVQNTGDRAGDEVIQLYVQPPSFSGKPFLPKIQLLGFERTTINPSVVHMTSFELNPYLLSLVDVDGERYLFPGKYMVLVGGGGEQNMEETHFTLTGDVTNVKDCPGAPQCLAC